MRLYAYFLIRRRSINGMRAVLRVLAGRAFRLLRDGLWHVPLSDLRYLERDPHYASFDQHMKTLASTRQFLIGRRRARYIWSFLPGEKARERLEARRREINWNSSENLTGLVLTIFFKRNLLPNFVFSTRIGREAVP